MNKGGDENNLHQRLCKAIITRNQMKYFLVEGDNAARLHGAGARVVEPHAYGVTLDGSPAILSWRWEARGSGPIAEAGWELVRLDEMHALQILDETFDRPAPGYTPGNKQMREIFAQV